MNDKVHQARPTRDAKQARGIKLTVLCLAVFIAIVVAGFVHRIQQSRVMSAAEMKINGLYLLGTP